MDIFRTERFYGKKFETYHNILKTGSFEDFLKTIIQV